MFESIHLSLLYLLLLLGFFAVCLGLLLFTCDRTDCLTSAVGMIHNYFILLCEGYLSNQVILDTIGNLEELIQIDSVISVYISFCVRYIFNELEFIIFLLSLITYEYYIICCTCNKK